METGWARQRVRWHVVASLVDHMAWDELQHLPAFLIHSESLWTPIKTREAQVIEEALHSRRCSCQWLTHGRPEPNNQISYVSAGQLFFMLGHLYLNDTQNPTARVRNVKSH